MVSSVTDSVTDGPMERIKIANELAIRSAIDPEVRGIAAKLLRDCHDIPGEAPEIIQAFIRNRHEFTYLMEAPSVELLQGPHTSLRNRTLDCDCAAILWAALTRSAGLRTFVVGIGAVDRYPELVHAVGYDSATGIHYELVDDHAYNRKIFTPRRFTRPEGYFGLYYSNEPGLSCYMISTGPEDPYTPMGDNMPMGYDPKVSGYGYSTDDPSELPYWQRILLEIIHGGAEVGAAAVAPEGYVSEGGQVTYYTEDEEQALTDARLNALEAQQQGSGIPTVLYVLGGVVLVGGLVYILTRNR